MWLVYEEHIGENILAIPHLASCWHIARSTDDALQELHDGFSPLASVASPFRYSCNGRSDGVGGTNMLLPAERGGAGEMITVDKSEGYATTTDFN